MADGSDGFTVVRARGRRGGAAAARRAHSPGTDTRGGGLYRAVQAPSAAEAQRDAARAVERQKRAVADKKAALVKSAFYGELCAAGLAALKEFGPEEIVCYGIGSLATDVSQWQLALLVALGDTLGAAMLAFDPASGPSDVAVLRGFGIATIAENEQARRRAERRTLFFMPHCEQFLYENVLAANWSRERLPRVAIVGNRLASYGDVLSGADFASKLPHVRRVLPAVDATALPDEKLLGLRNRPYAFSDTCIQRFDAARLAGIAELAALNGPGPGTGS